VPQDNYKKVYCDKWKAAFASNTVADSDDASTGSCVELRWKGIPLAEMFCGPTGVVFTSLYRFKGDPELTPIRAFPAAKKEFDVTIKHIETLEYICQMYDSAEPCGNEIMLMHAGTHYGSIIFNNGQVTYSGRTGNGWQPSEDPQTMIRFSKWLKDAGRTVEIHDDMELIAGLGGMLKR